MKRLETQVDVKGYLTVILLLAVTYLISYYMYSTNYLTYEQYKLAIQVMVVAAFTYIATLVVRNRDIMKLRPSRQTRGPRGEELESFVHKLHDEGKSIVHIKIVSGLSAEEIQKILETNEK